MTERFTLMNSQLSYKLKLKTPVLGFAAFMFLLLASVGLFFLLSLGGTSSALAATEGEGATGAAELATMEVIMYKIFRSPDGYAALVGGGFDEELELPLTFEIAVPTGVEILWFGEISGGPRDQDRTFPEPFNVRTEGGFDIYTAVSYEHVIQLEYILAEDPFEALGGGNHLYRLSYTPLHDAQIMRLAVYLPTGSNVADPAFQLLGHAPQTNEPLYGITFTNVTAGETYAVTLEYGPPAAIARQGAGNFWGGILFTAGIIAVALIAVVLVLVLAKNRKAQNEAASGGAWQAHPYIADDDSSIDDDDDDEYVDEEDRA